MELLSLYAIARELRLDEQKVLDEANLKALYSKNINDAAYTVKNYRKEIGKTGKRLNKSQSSKASELKKAQSLLNTINSRANEMGMGAVRYYGLSEDGTLNFKIKSQSRPGKYHYAFIESEDLLKFGYLMEQGDHFDVNELNKLLTMNGFRIQCNCFVAGTQVMTSEGVKNIEDVKIGDKVLTHRGNYKEVYDTFKRRYSGKLIRINGNITCTPNHLFYVEDNQGVCRWVEAQDLTPRFRLVTPLEPIGYVYKTTDTKNNKVYIGQKRSPDFIETYHGSGSIMTKLAMKHPDRLKTELLEFCASSELLDEREKYWINYYNSTDRTKGYNITPGGNYKLTCAGYKAMNNGVLYKMVRPEEIEDYLALGWEFGYTKERAAINAHSGWHHTAETLARISSSNKGRLVSEETKKKISETHKTIDHPQFRRPKSDETKRKMSESAKKRQRDQKGKFIGGI